MAIILKAEQDKSLLSENEIIDEILSGSRELFGHIIKKYNQRLYRIVRAYGIDDDNSEDLIQSTYIKAYRNLESFQKRSKFSTWIIRICINECLTYIRKQKTHPVQLHLVKTETANYVNSSETDYVKKEIKMIMENAIEDLPEKYRVIFVMREIEELSGRETAKILGLSESNVRVMLYRAKEMLRLDMTSKMGENEVYKFGNDRCNRLTERVMNIIIQM